MDFRAASIAMNQVGKIKQIAEFLKFMFFNARRVYVNTEFTHYQEVFLHPSSFIY